MATKPRTVLTIPKSWADQITARVQQLAGRTHHEFTVHTEPCQEKDVTTGEAQVYVKVTADTDLQAGVGIGLLVAAFDLHCAK